MRLDGKRVLVIEGGGAGIGRATTRVLGGAGASVVVADLDEGRVEEAAAGVIGQGGLA